ncbi:MAG TPA: Lrp/AsnC family transcriptional regulator [Blastocatellia bacterium]|nr:Lrp/AsnC family transcriptional regulator [Blastocatellia bacterium]
MTFDTIDYKLIDLLQQNARMTQMEMAGAVGLSQPAVAERMRKLEQEGVIHGYSARVDARKLGKDISAFIGVSIEHPRYNAGFAKKILALPDVLECHRVTGSDSYLLKVVTENTESLDRLISDLLRMIPGVTRTLTSIVTSSIKEGSHITPGDSEEQDARQPRNSSGKRNKRQ